MVSVFILPVLAAERRAFICPRCRESAYRDREITVHTTEDVVSCQYRTALHTHNVQVVQIYAYCDYCMYEWLAERETGIHCPYGP